MRGAAAAAGLLLAVTGFAAQPAASAQAAGGSWTTFGFDNGRDGNLGGPGFTTVSPAWTSPTGTLGQIKAQPLVFGGAVYVVTQSNWVYSLNQSTGQVNWSRNLGTPPGGYMCGNINGITGTPVIDPSANVMYLVAAVTPPGGGIANDIYKINLGDGSIATFGSAEFSGFDPTIEGQRGALALSNGHVYVPYGGRIGDCGSYHGYVVAFAATNLAYQGRFTSTPNCSGGGIWAAGGESVDGSGNVYAATGNGFCGSTLDLQESVVKLDATANLLGSWAPSNWQALDNGDTDIGSIAPTLLPGGLLFQSGKNGTGYVLTTAPALVTSLNFGGGECTGGSATDGAGNIYVGCSGGLFSLHFNGSTLSVNWQRNNNPTPVWTDTPIIAGGAIWAIDRNHNLNAFSPSGASLYHASLGASANFAAPSSAGGMVFTPAGSVVKAFSVNTVVIPGGYNILTSFGGIYSFGDATYHGNLLDHGYPGPAIGLSETPNGGGYNILTTFGGIYSFGNAQYFGNLIDHGYPGPAVALSMTPTGRGYAILTNFGGIYTFGDARYFGNLIDHGYPGTAVSVAYTATGNGYAILTDSGAIYTFGDAQYFGNLLDHGYPGPASGFSYTKSGHGYQILTAAGAIYTFGDAVYYGNLLDHGYPGPAVALSDTP
ncbi:MAG TPA: PQQ-binding-like beta-propeller repeat protein [Candidatus Dormibacteraeota bacterium]